MGEMGKDFCPNFLQPFLENIYRWSCNGGSRKPIPVFHNSHRKCRPSPSAVARILEFKFSRRPGLKRSSRRLLHQTGRTRRRQNSFACRVVNSWNPLPLTVPLAPDQRAFKKLQDSYIYPLFLLPILAPLWSFWANYSFPLITYVHRTNANSTHFL